MKSLILSMKSARTGMLKKYGRGTCRLDRAQKMQESQQKHGERHFSHRKQHVQRQSQERICVAAFLVVGKQNIKGGTLRSITSELDRNQRMKGYSGMTRSVDFITKVMRKHSMIVTKGVAQQKFCFRKITLAAVGRVETLTFQGYSWKKLPSHSTLLSPSTRLSHL